MFLENVPAIRTRGLKQVIKSFTDMGYDCRWTCVSATEVGACHLRKRWFILAHDRSERIHGIWPQKIQGQPSFSWSQNVGRLETPLRRPDLYTPQLCRASDGIPFRMERLKGLGNAVVPLQAKTAFMKLMGIKEL